ncbi:MAG: hypothetical protein IPI65_16335 [Bacteroidetes bacterium]|nr:hypothetical protein [Bacteroidota bacterium]
MLFIRACKVANPEFNAVVKERAAAFSCYQGPFQPFTRRHLREAFVIFGFVLFLTDSINFNYEAMEWNL